jgi:N-acetyl-gamma-glutamyl-phosphate reductase
MLRMEKALRIAILGASGYTGAELLRLLLAHPHAEIKLLTADSQAGKPMREVYPHLGFAGLPDTVGIASADFKDIDLVFCCLPHGTTQEVIAALPAHVKIIDLSADFRLADADVYAQWYGHAHKAPQLQKEAIYGLTELNRDAVARARLVANPGCYPTSAQLPLMPLLEHRVILPDGIIIDAKSGMTGAGRSAKQALLFTEVDGGIDAYSVGAHRHAPEIEQGLSYAAGCEVVVNFTPHHMPMNRGILSTIYVALAPGKTVDDIRRCLANAYANEPFVKVLPAGASPSTQMVRGTNLCVMAVYADRLTGRAILVSVIDNLVKGAAGQAIQNMNIMFGIPEVTGLQQVALFP